MFEETKRRLKEINDTVKDLSEPLKTIAITRLTKELWSNPTEDEIKIGKGAQREKIKAKNDKTKTFRRMKHE